jgi:hypothetical protein
VGGGGFPTFATQEVAGGCDMNLTKWGDSVLVHAVMQINVNRDTSNEYHSKSKWICTGVQN